MRKYELAAKIERQHLRQINICEEDITKSVTG
jgi:hypothetical protein